MGFAVARFCHEAGARLTVSEIYEPLAAKAAQELGAAVVPPDDIYDVECDVYSPNSIGGTINDDTVPRFRCAAVAGGATTPWPSPATPTCSPGAASPTGPTTWSIPAA